MAVKGSDTIFSKSFGTAHPVILTDSSGNIHTTVTDSPNIYKKAVENNVVTDFYLDWNGSEYQQPVNIGGFASAEVSFKIQYFWIVDEKEVEKTPYEGNPDSNVADDELTTAYAPGEYVPKGTKHLIRITSGAEDSGEYTVYAYAMSSRY